MSSAWFDFEKIADHLPTDGEAIIVFRRDGELGVKDCPVIPDDLLSDPEVFGRLVISNEQCRAASGTLFVPALIAILLTAGGLWKGLGLGWSWWWLHLAAVIAILGAQTALAGWLAGRAFRREVFGTIEQIRQTRRLTSPAFLAVIRQVPDLQVLARAYEQELARQYSRDWSG